MLLYIYIYQLREMGTHLRSEFHLCALEQAVYEDKRDEGHQGDVQVGGVLVVDRGCTVTVSESWDKSDVNKLLLCSDGALTQVA